MSKHMEGAVGDGMFLGLVGSIDTGDMRIPTQDYK
jgi:hypothetical protein